MKPTSHFLAYFRRGMVMAGLATLGSSTALAATWIWDADPGTVGPQHASGIWTNGAATWWSNATEPVNDSGATVAWDNGAGNVAQFGNGVGPALDSRTITVDGTVNAAGLIFKTFSAGAHGFILTGGTVDLGAGGTIDITGGPANDTINRHQILSSIAGSNIAIRRMTGGASNLATLQLRGTNTWTGNLALSSSEGSGLFVEVHSGGALNTLSTITIGASSTMTINTTEAITPNFSIGGTGAGGRGAIRFDANGSSVTGQVTLTAGSSITAFGNTTGTVSGNIVENSATIRNLSIGSGTNNGTVVLSGNNTYRGRTSISAGSLSVATINSVVGGTASSNMGAPTTVDNGTVNLGSGENAGTLIYTGAGETTDRVLNLNGTTGGGAVTQNGTGLLKFTSDLTATGAGLKNLTLQGSGTGEIAGRVVDNSSLNLTGVVKTGTGTWILSAANDYKGRTSVNNGSLSVSSINSVTGGTATSNLGAPTTVENGTINLGNTTSTGELLYTGTGETTDRVINLAGTTGGGIITNNGTGLLKFTSDLTATGLGNKTLTLQGSGNGEFAGAIVSSTGFNTGVAKSGTGTWTLSGANTYTGTSTVNDGTLRLAGVGLLSGGPLVMNGGTLELNGTTQSVGTLSGASGAVIRNGAAATNITFTYNQAASGTYAGIIEDGNGTLAVTKGGASSSTLTGNNTYTGLTRVSEGALVVGSNTALGSAVAGTLVQNTARVILADGVTVTGEEITIQGQGGGNGALQAFANSTATWNGNVKTVGTDVRLGAQAGGHLIINGDIGRAEGSMTSTITFRTVGDASTSGAELENTGVTLGGIYNLANINIFQGFVKIGASDRIADTTVVTLGTTASENIRQRFDLNGFNETIAGITTAGSAPSATHEVTNTSATASTLTLNSGTNRTFGGVVTGNLAIVKAGNNTVTFSGINSYTGNTTVNAGTFNVTGQLNGGGSLNVVTGATFTLGSAGVFQFNIGENGVNNVISGAGTTNLNGFLNFNLSFASIAEGNAWDLFETTGATSWNLAGVTSSAGNFTNNSGIWTLDEDGRSWSFDQTSGVLSLVQVPEPSQMLLTLGGLAGFALRRRRAI